MCAGNDECISCARFCFYVSSNRFVRCTAPYLCVCMCVTHCVHVYFVLAGGTKHQDGGETRNEVVEWQQGKESVKEEETESDKCRVVEQARVGERSSN
jgi:hypothetical protein